MIKPIRKLLVIFISCIIHIYTPSLMAQRPMIGLEFGYGRSQMTSHGHSFISPFDSDFYNRWNVGIQYGLPVSTWLCVSSGLEYVHRTGLDGRGISVDEKFSHLAIPLRVDFTLGNAFQLIIGPGLNLNYLIAYDLGYYKNHPGFKESKNVMQVNWQLHTGMGFQIKRKTRIYFLHELGFDLTKIYNFHHPNADYTLSKRWYDGILTVGAMTYMKPKQSKQHSLN